MLEGCLTSLKISSLKKKGFQFLYGLASVIIIVIFIGVFIYLSFIYYYKTHIQFIILTN